MTTSQLPNRRLMAVLIVAAVLVGIAIGYWVYSLF
jgi:hypothetical protein